MGVSFIEKLYAAGDALAGKFLKLVGAQDDAGAARALSISDARNLRTLLRAIQISGSVPQPNGRLPFDLGAGPLEVEPFIDIYNNLVTRGQVLTDEESIRDDFEGTGLTTALASPCTLTGGTEVTAASGFVSAGTTDQHYFKFDADPTSAWAHVEAVNSDGSITLGETYGGAATSGAASITRWPITAVGAGTSPTVGASKVALASGTANGNVSMIARALDYSPMLFRGRVGPVSQRIANQTFVFGMQSDTTATPDAQAVFVVDGVTNTTIKTRTSYGKTGGVATVEENTVTLPFGLTTATVGGADFEIDASMGKVVFLVAGVPVATHKLHIPGPYDALFVVFRLANQAAVTNTTVNIDNVFVSNQDQVEIANSFSGQSIPVRLEDEIHTAIGVLTTTATTADQVVLTLTVPTGRTLFVVGYLVSNNSTTINSNTTKVGKNGLTLPTTGTTQIDGECLDALNYVVGALNYVVGASNNAPLRREFLYPVRFAAGGDVVKIAVTPSGATSTVWRATLQYILR